MSEAHRRFISRHRCVACYGGRIIYVAETVSQCAHVRYLGSGMGQRKDEHSVPLCPRHHDAQHKRGDERTWWEVQGIDPAPIAQELVRTSPDRRMRDE